MLIVCSPPLPVWWQTSIFVWPWPKSPPLVSVSVDAVVPVDEVVEVVLSEVDVEVEVGTEVEVDVEVVLELVEVDVEFELVWDSVVLVAEGLSEAVVICASPTPAAAANARPTSAPTRERRVMLLNRLRTSNPFSLGEVAAYPRQSPPRGQTCGALPRSRA
jgi:hypothetical protein